MGAPDAVKAKPGIENPPLVRPEAVARRGQFDVERTREGVLLRVKNTTDPKLLAASISFALAESLRVTLRAVGPHAVNQLLKACAIARMYIAVRGLDLIVRPGFQTLNLPSLDPDAPPGQLVEQTAIICILTAQ